MTKFDRLEFDDQAAEREAAVRNRIRRSQDDPDVDLTQEYADLAVMRSGDNKRIEHHDDLMSPDQA